MIASPSLAALCLLVAIASSAATRALLSRMGTRNLVLGALSWRGGARDSPAHQAKHPPVSVNFHLANSTVQALGSTGDKISDLAARANVTIRYKCRKGECGTCQVKLQGRWVKACQEYIPAPHSKDCNVTIVVPAEGSSVPTSALFSPGSILEGMVNNAIGMAAFVANSFAAGDEFSRRMQREKDLAARAQARRQRLEAARNSSG